MLNGIEHVTIRVSNLENGLRFYRDVLGLKLQGQNENRYIQFKVGRFRLFLQAGGDTRTTATDIVIAFAVQDIDMAYEELKRKGVLFSQPPKMQKFGSKTALFRDPDGHILELVGN
ncbi:MAG: hypothetical protein A2Z34_01880 [Planctomycetes bacterium RBG_16_59_8]|nr:MAG: hypothetical protein A2Z34_01880 [Planctomycetes bacterium RBG_16_59_8]